MIKGIIAHGLDGSIGKDNSLLWKLPKDLEYFKERTLEGCVLMGRNTFESLPFEKGLPERENCVVTSRVTSEGYVLGKGYHTYFDSLEGHIEDYKILSNDGFEDVWVVGGKSIYEQMEQHIDLWHVTEVQSKFPEADTFFKPDLTDFERVGEEIEVSSDELEAFVQVWRRKE